MNSRDKVTCEDRSKKKVQKSRPKKKKQYFNPKTVEVDESSFSASRKKLKFKGNIHVPVDLSIQYRIVNYLLVFTAISKDELLERYLGGFTQNSNESYSQLIWKLSPKTSSRRCCTSRNRRIFIGLQHQLDFLEAASSSERTLYGPGIDDDL